MIFSSFAWSLNRQSKEEFIEPGKHKIEIYSQGVRYVGILHAFQNGDGSWTVSGESESNSGGNELKILGTMNQMLQPGVLNEFYFAGSIFIKNKENQAILNTGDMVLVKKRGENYFQSDQKKCKRQEENRPMSYCMDLGSESHFRFYP